MVEIYRWQAASALEAWIVCAVLVAGIVVGAVVAPKLGRRARSAFVFVLMTGVLMETAQVRRVLADRRTEQELARGGSVVVRDRVTQSWVAHRHGERLELTVGWQHVSAPACSGPRRPGCVSRCDADQLHEGTPVEAEFLPSDHQHLLALRMPDAGCPASE